jgi:fumarylpyruvate hydrolase
MTRRDLQGEMKKIGRPWKIGKASEWSVPMGPIVPISETGQVDSGSISLSVDMNRHM